MIFHMVLHSSSAGPWLGFVNPGHAAKNSGGQVSTACRTLYLGKFWVDVSGARSYGLPAAAFVRADGQSDALQAALSNPWFFVSSVEGNIELLQVPWSTRGALLWSLSTACCFSPWLHKAMSVEQRAETAMAGFVLWDLWRLCSARMEASTGSKVGSMTMSAQTAQNLQNLSLSMVVMLLTKQDFFWGGCLGMTWWDMW